jgi:hypothetical protein
MYIQVFGHATVQADGLSLCQIAFFVVRSNTFLLTSVGHPPVPEIKNISVVD